MSFFNPTKLTRMQQSTSCMTPLKPAESKFMGEYAEGFQSRVHSTSLDLVDYPVPRGAIRSSRRRSAPRSLLSLLALLVHPLSRDSRVVTCRTQSVLTRCKGTTRRSPHSRLPSHNLHHVGSWSPFAPSDECSWSTEKRAKRVIVPQQVYCYL